MKEIPQLVKVEKTREPSTTINPLGGNRWLALVVLVISTILFGILFFPAAICAITVPITTNFQQSRPVEIAETYFLAFYFLSLPLIIISALVAAWVKYHREAYRNAILLSVIPVIYFFFYEAMEFLFDYVLKRLPFL